MTGGGERIAGIAVIAAIARDRKTKTLRLITDTDQKKFTAGAAMPHDFCFVA
jgi:hypothetical protein